MAEKGGTKAPLYAENETDLLAKLTDAIKQAKLKLALIFNKDGYKERSKLVLNQLGSKRVKKNQKKISNQLQLI